MAKFKIANLDTIRNFAENAASRVNVFKEQSSAQVDAGKEQAEQDASGNVVTSAMLGTPVYDRLLFQSEDIVNDLTFDEVILSVSQNKQIVKTPINGRNGTVKEYIALDDYRIMVRGVIIDSNPHKRDNEKIELLQAYGSINVQLKVASKFLALFGISSVVVESYSVGQTAGTRQVPFSMSLISDEDIELQLGDEQNAYTTDPTLPIIVNPLAI